MLFYYFIQIIRDQYLARLLAGWDPHQTTFIEIPPYFKVDMKSKDIHDFMYLLYGPIIGQYEENLKLNHVYCFLQQV